MEASANPHEKATTSRLGIGSDFPRYAEVRALVSGILRVADTIVLVTAAVLTYWFRNDQFEMPPPYLLATGLSVVMLLSIGQVTGLYRFETVTRFPQQLGAASLALSATMAALAMAGYLTKTADIFSRLWLITWCFTAYTGIVITRVIAVRRLEAWHARGGLQRRLAIVGSGEKSERLIRHLKTSPDGNIMLVGVFDDDLDGGGSIEGTPVLGTIHTLVSDAVRL